MTKKDKSKVVAVTLYPTDLEIVAHVMEDYGCNRSAAMRIAIRGYGSIYTLAARRHVTVHELTGLLSFSSFVSEGGEVVVNYPPPELQPSKERTKQHV